MLKNKIILVLILVTSVLSIIFYIIQKQELQVEMRPEDNDEVSETVLIPEPEPETEQFERFTATFEIYTLGTKRTFTNPMYHNRSEEVYIDNTNPHVIHVKKNGSTWNDFFETLPFSLDKECLTTGTGQTFCTDDSGTLKFILNDVDNPNALGQPIQPNSHLKVEYL